MTEKKQNEILLGLFVDNKTWGLEEYLKYACKHLYTGLNPISAAVYLSLKSEEKLVLVDEYGENFDKQIKPIYNFSLNVRNAIKKRDIIYIPDDIENTDNPLEISAILIPLIGNSEVIGMLGLIFKIDELNSIKEYKNFYLLIGRFLGSAAMNYRFISDFGRNAEIDPDKDHFDRLMSLGVLSTEIAHGFNNIFAVIKGYAELMMMKSLDNDAVKNAIEMIDKQTERGAELIERLNIFSKGNVNKLEYYPIEEIVDEIIDMQGMSLENEKIKVSTNYEETPKILVDKKQIKEVVLNLFLTARHSINKTGTGNIEVSTKYLNEKVILVIRDDGQGVSIEHTNMTADSFKSVKDLLKSGVSEGKDAGIGISLAIAYGIIESHGGGLTIESELDEGTAVEVYFTRTELGEERSLKYINKDIVYFGDASVLIVDDEEAIREILYSAFDQMGYQVISAANGEDAVEICSCEDIDIVFLDYWMPGLKGDKTFKTIKKVSPETEVVLMTGASEIPQVETHYKDGLAYVLKKPFKINKIIQITNDLIYKKINKKRGS